MSEAEAAPDGPGKDGSDAGPGGDGEAAETTTEARPGPEKEKEGRVRRTVRKVNELAHANFQRLKLRNSGAKGGAAHNSRFRRRR